MIRSFSLSALYFGRLPLFAYVCAIVRVCTCMTNTVYARGRLCVYVCVCACVCACVRTRARVQGQLRVFLFTLLEQGNNLQLSVRTSVCTLIHPSVHPL